MKPSTTLPWEEQKAGEWLQNACRFVSMHGQLVHPPYFSRILDKTLLRYKHTLFNRSGISEKVAKGASPREHSDVLVAAAVHQLYYHNQPVA